MKQIVLYCMVLVSVLTIGHVVCNGQESTQKQSPDDLSGLNPNDSLNYYRSLHFQQAMQEVNKNDSSLYTYWKSIEITNFSKSMLYNNFIHCSNDAYGSSTGSLMDQYKKIDLSKSRNLDYKRLSEKYPKSFEDEHPWGGLLLYSIFSTIYPNHGYAPALNNK